MGHAIRITTRNKVSVSLGFKMHTRTSRTHLPWFCVAREHHSTIHVSSPRRWPRFAPLVEPTDVSCLEGKRTILKRRKAPFVVPVEPGSRIIVQPSPFCFSIAFCVLVLRAQNAPFSANGMHQTTPWLKRSIRWYTLF